MAVAVGARVGTAVGIGVNVVVAAGIGLAVEVGTAVAAGWQAATAWDSAAAPRADRNVRRDTFFVVMSSPFSYLSFSRVGTAQIAI